MGGKIYAFDERLYDLKSLSAMEPSEPARPYAGYTGGAGEADWTARLRGKAGEQLSTIRSGTSAAAAVGATLLRQGARALRHGVEQAPQGLLQLRQRVEEGRMRGGRLGRAGAR